MAIEILIVDDNIFNIATLQCIISESLKGVQSDQALNGREAVDAVLRRSQMN